MSSAAMAGTEMGQELAAQTGYGGAGWAGPSGVGGEPVAGSVALTGENPISSGWIGMVGSGIGLSTKAFNKALQEGKALHKGIKALDKGIKALDKGKGKGANRICSGKKQDEAHEPECSHVC